MKVAVRFCVYLLDRTIKRGSRIKRLYLFCTHSYLLMKTICKSVKACILLFHIVLTQFRSKKGFTKSYVIIILKISMAPWAWSSMNHSVLPVLYCTRMCIHTAAFIKKKINLIVPVFNLLVDNVVFLKLNDPLFDGF